MPKRSVILLMLIIRIDSVLGIFLMSSRGHRSTARTTIRIMLLLPTYRSFFFHETVGSHIRIGHPNEKFGTLLAHSRSNTTHDARLSVVVSLRSMACFPFVRPRAVGSRLKETAPHSSSELGSTISMPA